MRAETLQAQLEGRDIVSGKDLLHAQLNESNSLFSNAEPNKKRRAESVAQPPRQHNPCLV